MAKKTKKSPSLTAIIGFILGVGCVVIGIFGAGNANTFINAAAIFITIGGTTGVVIISFPAKRLKTLGSVLKKVFTHEKCDSLKDIDTLVALSQVSRQKGLLALETAVNDYTDDDFMIKGVLLLVDGADRDALRSSLMTELYFMQQRHKKGYGMLDMISATSPSLGLLGTYIGLIPMLVNLQDPSSIGPKMAVQLVTSFYGAFLAFIIFTPFSKRLKTLSAEEVTRKELIIEGLTGIQEGKNPRVLREELMTYISRKEAKGVSKRKNFEDEGKPEMKKVVNYGNRKAV
ncbi:MAG: motility protein A [Clostridiaceae bacterium]|nr:motility protein A [Clostridiaceae bacterium]